MIKYSEIPTQILDKSEASVTLNTGDISSYTASTALISNFLLKFVTAGAMDHIWSLLNNIQVAQMLRLTDVKSPGNVNLFTELFNELSSVEIIDIEGLMAREMYISEIDTFSLNF